VVAIGKVRVVGDVHIMHVGARPDDLTQDRETAEAGIKYENRQIRRHPNL
jgi:hypothetical protein